MSAASAASTSSQIMCEATVATAAVVVASATTEVARQRYDRGSAWGAKKCYF